MVNEWLRMPDDDDYDDCSTFCDNYDDNADDDNGNDDDDDLQGNPLLRRPDDRLKSTDFTIVGSLCHKIHWNIS